MKTKRIKCPSCDDMVHPDDWSKHQSNHLLRGDFKVGV